MRNLSALLLSLLVIFISFSTVLAETSYEGDIDEDYQKTTESFGVSTESPGGSVAEDDDLIQPFGTYKPSKTHNIKTSGRMSFAGKADGSTLYTNKKFKSYSSYKMLVNNFSNHTLTVKIHKATGYLDPVVKTYTVEPGKYRYAYPYGLDANQEYFISLSAPSNFDGYIEY